VSTQLFERFVLTLLSRGVVILECDPERAEVLIGALDEVPLAAPVRLHISGSELASTLALDRDHRITPPGAPPPDPEAVTFNELVDDLEESIRDAPHPPERITFRKTNFVSQLRPIEIVELARDYATHVRENPPLEWDEPDPQFRVWDYATRADDPLPLLDAILGYESGDDAIVGPLGAGPLEDLLTERPDLWDQIDERARREPVWAAAAGGSWLAGHLHDRLPEHLASLVTRLDSDHGAAPRQRKSRPRRPAKRQNRKGRNR
jgi:hypothetical protein